MAKNKVILIGDSIRMGYQEFARAECAGTTDVWAPAENGGTSRNVLAHLDEWVISRRPDVVHVNCGLHDIRREFGAEPAVPLAEYPAPTSRRSCAASARRPTHTSSGPP